MKFSIERVGDLFVLWIGAPAVASIWFDAWQKGGFLDLYSEGVRVLSIADRAVQRDFIRQFAALEPDEKVESFRAGVLSFPAGGAV